MKNKIKETVKKNKFYLIIFAIVIILFLPICTNLYVGGHDTDYHISNILAIMENIDISNGKFFPDKVVPLIANNFGWGNGIFYPSFPHYITAYIGIFLSIFNITVVSAMKLTHFITVLASGIFMFWLMKKKTKNNYASLFSSIIYITFPYFITDFFIRDAYAETFMFVFIPLIFLGLEYLFEQNYKKFYIFFIIGYIGVMNSHLVLSVYLTIFVIVFLLLNYKFVFKTRNIVSLFISAILILCFTSPFTIPLIEHTINGKYVVYLKDYMYSYEKIQSSLVNFNQYFTNESIDFIPRTISFVGLISFILVLINLKKINNKSLVKYIILCCVVVLMLSPLFPWSKMPSFLLNIQFVWRLETFLVFFISVVSGYAIYLFDKKNLKNFISISLIVAIIQAFMIMNNATIMQIHLNYIDFNTKGAAQYQYIPASAFENQNYFLNRNDKIKLKSGQAQIKIVENNTPYLKFEVSTKEKITIEIPRFFYFGYDIVLDNGKDKKHLAYKENKNGFIELTIPYSGTVIVKYSGTNGYKLSLILFLFATITSLIYLIKCKTFKKIHK